MDWKHWAHGLLAAIVSSTVTTVGATVGATASGTPMDAKATGGAALGGAIAGAAMYLKQSPIPPEKAKSKSKQPPNFPTSK